MQSATPARLAGLELTRLGFGAFKIGRNQGIKYARGYELPDDAAVSRLLNGVLDLGINYIDTAPAYGTSEERIGNLLHPRNHEFVISTKAGETFEDGRSTHDFSRVGILGSVHRSLKRLRRDQLDLLFLHSPGDDLRILSETDAVPTLLDLKSQGLVRFVGLSGKTVEGAQKALSWADALMLEYHREDISHSAVIDQACNAGVGVIVKKGLASGRLPAADAIRFVFANSGVTSLVVGGLNLEHLRENIRALKPSQEPEDSTP